MEYNLSQIEIYDTYIDSINLDNTTFKYDPISGYKNDPKYINKFIQ